MNIVFDRFPGGRRKALTLSYDDGTTHDRRMIETMNRYGLKGTFHLNSEKLDQTGYVKKNEVRELYAGHEVAAHSVTHPHLPHIPKEMRVRELMNDRQELERIVGYPVKGMSYPYGTFSKEVAELLPMLGIDYSRTTISSSTFNLPTNFHEWSATCHHRDDLMKRTQAFLDQDPWNKPMLFYVWGHSHEFDRNQNWDLLESFCEAIGTRDTIWYATNKQIVDYMKALYRLEVSVDGLIIYNPSAMPVCFTADGIACEIGSGAVWRGATD